MLLTIEKVMIMKTTDIFSQTREEYLAEVAAVLEEFPVKAGQTIIEKGEIGNAMYIIAEGRVRVHDGNRTIAVLGPRDVFGELAALDPEPRMASVTAVEDSQVFRLDQEALYEMMAEHIEVVRGIIRVLCRRLRATTSAPRSLDTTPS